MLVDLLTTESSDPMRAGILVKRQGGTKVDTDQVKVRDTAFTTRVVLTSKDALIKQTAEPWTDDSMDNTSHLWQASLEKLWPAGAGAGAG